MTDQFKLFLIKAVSLALRPGGLAGVDPNGLDGTVGALGLKEPSKCQCR